MIESQGQAEPHLSDCCGCSRALKGDRSRSEAPSLHSDRQALSDRNGLIHTAQAHTFAGHDRSLLTVGGLGIILSRTVQTLMI